MDLTWHALFSVRTPSNHSTVKLASSKLVNMLGTEDRPPPEGVAVWDKRDDGWPTTIMVSLSQKGSDTSKYHSPIGPGQVPNESGKH